MSFLRRKKSSSSQPSTPTASSTPNPSETPPPSSSGIPLPKKSPSKLSLRRSNRSSMPPSLPSSTPGASTTDGSGGSATAGPDPAEVRKRRSSLKGLFTGSLGSKSKSKDRPVSYAAPSSMLPRSASGNVTPSSVTDFGRPGKLGSTPGGGSVPTYLRRRSSTTVPAAASTAAAATAASDVPPTPTTPPSSHRVSLPATPGSPLPGASDSPKESAIVPSSPAIPFPQPATATAQGTHAKSPSMSAHELLQSLSKSPPSGSTSPSFIARRKSSGAGSRSGRPSRESTPPSGTVSDFKPRVPSLAQASAALGAVLSSSPASESGMNETYKFGSVSSVPSIDNDAYRLQPPPPLFSPPTPSEQGSIYQGNTPPSINIPTLLPEPVETVPVVSPQPGDLTKDSPTSPASAAATPAWWTAPSNPVDMPPLPESAQRPSASPTPSFVAFDKSLKKAESMEAIQDERPTYLDLPHSLKRRAEDDSLLSTSPPKALKTDGLDTPDSPEPVDLSLSPAEATFPLPPSTATSRPPSSNATPRSQRTSSLNGSGDHSRLPSSSPVLYHLPARKQSHQFSKAEVSDMEASSAWLKSPDIQPPAASMGGADVFGPVGSAGGDSSNWGAGKKSSFRDHSSTGSVTEMVLEDSHRIDEGDDDKSDALEEAEEGRRESVSTVGTFGEDDEEEATSPALIMQATLLERLPASPSMPAFNGSTPKDGSLPAQAVQPEEGEKEETKNMASPLIRTASSPSRSVESVEEVKSAAVDKEKKNEDPISPPASLTFFSPVAPPPAFRAESTRLRRTSSKAPAPPKPILSLPSPLPVVLPYVPIPWSLLPTKLRQIADRPTLDVHKEDVYRIQEEIGKVFGLGLTVAKWSVGWWIIIPVRTGRWALGV